MEWVGPLTGSSSRGTASHEALWAQERQNQGDTNQSVSQGSTWVQTMTREVLGVLRKELVFPKVKERILRENGGEEQNNLLGKEWVTGIGPESQEGPEGVAKSPLLKGSFLEQNHEMGTTWVNYD